MPDSSDWHPDVRILITEDEVQAKVRELGKAITRDYAGCELVLVGVLKGSFLFMADLCRHIQLPLKCDFLGVSSYGDSIRSSGVIRITSDLKRSIEGEDVLVVEDIVDTGLTIRYLMDNLGTRLPKSLRTCTLLNKPARRKVEVPLDYVGFDIEDRFVVGYGLDYLGRYRNLDFVGVMDSIDS
jgi:hypoxanthine phosphoribosyltransferase